MADLLAGITVGLVALPLAMAFAIASGVPPQTGLYCAIVAGFAISALGGGDCMSSQLSSGRYDTHRFVELSYPRMLSSGNGEQVS